MNHIIRKATKSDIPAIYNLISEFYIDFHRGKIVPLEFHHFINFKSNSEEIQNSALKYVNDATFFTFVAEVDTRICGYITGYILAQPEMELDKAGIIEEWFVTEKFRGKEIGKNLYTKLVDIFTENKCSHIEVSAFYQNEKTLKVYEKLGFSPIRIELMKKCS